MFITLEGMEAVGKTTQLALLKEALEQQGKTVLVTREPGGTRAAEALRGVLLTHSPELPPLAQAMVANAARMAHLKDVIVPALKAGQTVLCDRFIDSTMVYQGYLHGDDALTASVRTLTLQACGGVLPRRTIILDMPVGAAQQRLEKRGGAVDAFEALDEGHWQRMREGFLTCAARHPERCRVVDASGDAESVHSAIMTALSS